MRKLLIACLAIVVALGGCGKEDDPTFSSAEGNWIYTTPDAKLTVEFSLKKNDAGWVATDQSITVDGTKANAVIQTTALLPPAIGSIRINANDGVVMYPYFVLFEDAEVSSDFKQINVASASYTWPHDKTNSLTNITITRK